MASIKLKGDVSGEVTISAPAVAGTTTLELPATSSTLATQNSLGVRNLIINGDMRIAQRGTSSTGLTGDNFNYNSVDRFQTVLFTTTSVWTQSQSTDVPTGQGFSNSLKMDCTTADASLDAGTNITIEHKMEGQNLQHLKKGTASAESLTLSFWVKSNKTGTYIVELDDNDNARNINNAYTINAADTWEKKTITIDGDTTGTLDNDNGHSLRIIWWLAVGSNYSSGTLQTSWGSTVNANRAVGQVNLADSTSNYINITGVQLEVGDATPFEHRPYDMELQRCMRYYHRLTGNNVDQKLIGAGGYFSSTGYRAYHVFPTTMRAEPTVNYSNIADLGVVGINVGTVSSLSTFDESTHNMGFSGTVSTSTSGSFAFLRFENSASDSYMDFSAEL